jgi:HK97 family phage major capsid protein
MMTSEEFFKLPKDQQDALMKKVSEIQGGQAQIAAEEKNMPKLSMKEMKEMIEETAKQYIKSMTPVDRKYFMFPGIGKDGADDTSTEAKFTKTVKFIKALVGKDTQTLNLMDSEVRTKANLSEGSTTAGGFLVPEEFKAEILRLAPLYGVIRREARLVPMSADVCNFPAAGTTDQSAIWTNEAAQIKQTNPTFRQVVLTINKLAAIPKVTNELLADANVQVVQYLSEIIADAFAKAEDEQAFNGSGSPFVGVLQATGSPARAQAGGTAAQSLSYQDLINATGDIYENALQGAKFYFNRSMNAHIRGLITTAGAPIFGGTANEIAGFPLVGVEVLPLKTGAAAASTAYAIFGNLRRGVMMGERGSISMKISDQATVDSDNLFEKDMSALRAIERVCLGVALPSSYVRITTGAS